MSSSAETGERKSITTDPQIRALKPHDRAYYVSLNDPKYPGLEIRVAPDGRKSWSKRYRTKGGRQRRWTLGTYPTVSLTKAHEKATDAGEDPQAAKEEQRGAMTFGTFANVYIEKHAKVKKRSWKADEWQLNTYVLSKWKHLPVKGIMRADVRKLLDGIADGDTARGGRPAPILANRVRSLLNRLFKFAIGRDEIDMNPVSGTEKNGNERARVRVLTHDEIRTIWQVTEALPLEMKATWRLRLLTAQRSGEINGMQWSELDLTTGWWEIPAARTKNAKLHRVPLSAPALELLNEIKVTADAFAKEHPDSPDACYVLRLARGKRQQADAAELFELPDFVGHDLRRTAATRMAELRVPAFNISRVLNHSEGKSDVTGKHYNHYEYDDEKKEALNKWASEVLRIVEGATVIPFAARG
jgi:integrase